MDFYELKVFMDLTKTLQFARTAQNVNLSPSALSRLISRLEEETSVTLFERNNKEVTITEDGKKFALFAQKCLDERESIQNDFDHRDDSLHGNLNLYASVTACYTVLPPFIKILSQKYPDVHLSIETGDPALAISAVKEGRADLAVAAIPDTQSEVFDTVSVKHTPLVFASSTQSSFTDFSGSPQDLVSSVPLILPKAGLARQRFNDWVKSRNVKPNIAAETEGNEAIMALCALGIGLGLVPKIVLENGPYREGFVCHSALSTLNSLGFYDIGFIQKREITGSINKCRLRKAVNDILHETKWNLLDNI